MREAAEDPSFLHQDIVDLMNETGGDTIITTNWDKLLEKAAVGWDVWEKRRRGYEAGKKARGIIHLHGTVDRPGEMLATGKELNEHYKVGKQREFIQGLFERRTVLCVGYSHQDEMIAKILEGSGPRGGARRYSIIPIRDGEDEKEVAGKLEDLRKQHIDAITYRCVNENHKPVRDVIKALRRREDSMRATAEMKGWFEMGKRGPKAMGEKEWPKLQEVVEEGGARLSSFLNGADVEAWTGDEAERKGGLGRAFEERPDWWDTSNQLAGWLMGGSEDLDEKLMRNLLRLTRVLGRGMPSGMRHMFGGKLAQSKSLKPHQRALGGLVLLGEAEVSGMVDTDTVMMHEVGKKCAGEGHDEVALRTLEALANITGQSGVQHDYLSKDGGGDRGRASVTAPCDTPTIGYFWEETVLPITGRNLERVWRACTGALRRQHEIVAADAGRADAWNVWSYKRSAIEDHAQDRHDTGSLLRVLVDGARTVLEEAGKKEKEEKLWQRYVEEANAEASPLLKRLAIHGVITGEHWSDGRKLAWWRETKASNDQRLRHEAYRLVASTWKGAGEPERKRAVEAIRGISLEHLEDEDEETKKTYEDRVRFDLVRWIQTQAPETRCRGLTALEAELEKAHPDWKPREHPDFLNYVTTGWVGRVRPEGWTKEELLREWQEEGEKAIDRVIDYDAPSLFGGAARLGREGPTQEGAREAVEETAREEIGWGIAIAARMAERKRWDHPLWTGIGEALPEHVLDERVIEALEQDWWTQVAEAGEHQEWVVGRLANQTGTQARQQKANRSTMRRLGRAVRRWLAENRNRKTKAEGPDWLTLAINDPLGMIVEGYMSVVGSAETREEEVKEALGAIERKAGEGGKAKRVITTLIAQNWTWVLARSPETFERMIERELEEAGENGEMRGVIWNGLGYSTWNLSREALKRMKPLLKREVRYPDCARGGVDPSSEDGRDVGASRYATSATMEIQHDGASWESWGVRGVPVSRREQITKQVCGHFWREKEVAERKGWRKVLRPMWDEILAGEEQPTEAEQRKLLLCFEKLAKEEAAEFAERFEKGPPVEPEWFLAERRDGRNVPNREAALRVLEHCQKAPQKGPASYWKWRDTMDTVKAWREEAAAGTRLRRDIDDIIARQEGHGGEGPKRR